MKVWVKVQKVMQEDREEIVVAVCDKNLLGKEFDFFKISEHFFKGELMEIEDAIKELEKATIANIVGGEIISKLIEKGIIEKENVKETNGIPHAQIYVLNG
ncbi:MAG: DUF424 family protein [Nanoarchaeota archaeon]|nr:DUF424 family protein [Nanoarchaeota archaeon]